jgi:hypothetical protein
MRQRGLVRLALGGIGAVIIVAGCGSSGGSGPSRYGGPNLAGNYELDSLQLAGGPVQEPPGATGTLAMTQSSTGQGSITVNLTIDTTTTSPGPNPPLVIGGSGSYAQVAANDSIYWSLAPYGTFGGTYHFGPDAVGGKDTLRANLAASGLSVRVVFVKP